MRREPARWGTPLLRRLRAGADHPRTLMARVIRDDARYPPELQGIR